MYFFNLKIKSLTSQKGLNSWDLLRASSSPHWPWREGPEMTLNGHSTERLHTAENGEINRNCSSTKHAFRCKIKKGLAVGACGNGIPSKLKLQVGAE